MSTTLQRNDAILKNITPAQYRLVQCEDGTLKLQGLISWRSADGKNAGITWEDIPTVLEKDL